jgi:uncharacterized protein
MCAFRSIASAALFVATLGIGAARAETPIPSAPATFVTDHVGLLSPAVAQRLEERLGAVDRETGHQVLVYIDRTTGGAPIEDWAVRAFERWRPGRKSIDDGVVIFVFEADRRVRIEVGYGLEAALPDLRAKRIIDEMIVPHLRAGDGDGAVEGGVAGVLVAIGAAGVGPGPGELGRQISPWALVVGGLVLLLLVSLFVRFAVRHPALATWLFLMGSGRGGGRGGGISGGGGFSGGGGRSGGGGASGGW